MRDMWSDAAGDVSRILASGAQHIEKAVGEGLTRYQRIESLRRYVQVLFDDANAIISAHDVVERGLCPRKSLFPSPEDSSR